MVLFMNEWDIDDALERARPRTVRHKAARFLASFRGEVDSHSDGWCYWRLPVDAAKRLMELLLDREHEPTEEQYKKALVPIKSFYTKHGNKAGMTMPAIDDAAEERRLRGITEARERAELARLKTKYEGG